jgi:membrane-bound lytic murein transglycosylase D
MLLYSILGFIFIAICILSFRKKFVKAVYTAFCLILSVSLLSGCAHFFNKTDTNSGNESQIKNADGSLKNQTVVTNESASDFRLSDPEPPKVVDEELENIPVEINPLVEKWIAYFQSTKGRLHMERYLSRSTRYSALMKKILRENGVPEDLIYIALIESGFSPRATSSAAAVGYWQFIRGTGKRYGLDINAFEDERRDPVLATQAAAEYFKGLYSVFGSWYLSMAAYNVGENRVKREIMNHYTRDFWELARKKRFPKETINYVPKFIAAKLIAKDPAKYGFEDIDYMPPIEFEHIISEKPVNIRLMAEKLNIPYDEFKALNPKFRGEIAPLDGTNLVLRIPIGTKEAANIAAQESTVEKIEFVADAGDLTVYRVKSGDSLRTIARKFRTTVANLRDINDLPRKRKLKLGMKLQVPDRTLKRLKNLEARSSSSTKGSSLRPKNKFHVVKNGETLHKIADLYKVSLVNLRQKNKIISRTRLTVGSQLLIPSAEASE